MPAVLDLVAQIGVDDGADCEEQIGPMLDAVMAAARKARSFEEFQETLTGLYATLPTSALARRIALATTKARGLGEVTDDV